MLIKAPLVQGWRQGALATRRPAPETEAKNILTKMDSKIKPKIKEKSYQAIKSAVGQIRYEFTNQDTIVFSKNGLFYKSYGNSAVLLKHYGITTSVNLVYNKVYEQDILEINIHSKNFEGVLKLLKTHTKEVLVESEKLYVLRLKNPISAKELKKKRTDPQIKQEIATAILIKNKNNSLLSKKVRDVFFEISHIAKNMPKSFGPALASLLITKALCLNQLARRMQCNKGTTEESVSEILGVIDDLQSLLLLVYDFRQQAVRIATTGRLLLDVQKIVNELELSNSKNANGKAA